MAPGDKASKQPSTFADAVSAAAQDIAAGLAAPDADVHFATQVLQVLGMYAQSKHNPQGQGKAGAGAGAGPGGGATAGPPPSPGGSPSGPNPSGAGPAPAGGGAANPSMQSMNGPTPPPGPGQGPSSGGPTAGLTPDPDEMRRVLQEVAGN